MIFGESGSDEVVPYGPEEIHVQGNVHDGEYSLFRPVPDIVDVDIRVVDLQSCRQPDAVYADVDQEHNGKDAEFEPPGERFVDHNQRHSIDDDLKDALHLNYPKCHCIIS